MVENGYFQKKAIQVLFEIRRYFCGAPLEPSIELIAPGPLSRFQIFFLGDTAIDLGEFMGSVFRPILVHDVDIRMGRDLLGDEPENGFRRSHSIRASPGV